MKEQILSILLLSFILMSGAFTANAKEITFQWFGQACFLIKTSQGTNLITDPLKMGKYTIPEDIMAHVVTVSHEHFDHNQVGAVSGDPVVLRGLASEGKEFNEVDKKIRDVRIFCVESYHDESSGSQRGKNAIFVYEFDGIRVAHLGDLGHILSNEQLKKIGKIDVLMIPVGGTFTIFGREAEKVVAQLEPRMIVFPMHFKTSVADFLPYNGDDFTKGNENVKKIERNIYKLDLSDPPQKPVYIVLNYE